MMDKEKYPQGKLNETDEGVLALEIGEESGKVVVKFLKPTAWIALNPDETMEFAQLLINRAKRIGLTKPFSLQL